MSDTNQTPTNRDVKKAERAEQYGRTVGPTLADYEKAASRGRDSLSSALISRHNQRMERIGDVQVPLRRRSRMLVNQLYVLDLGLRKLGADASRAPVDYGDDWVGHLDWGVDSVIASVRLLLAGQLVGAAQIARSQIERWALNLEHNAGLTHSSGESKADYYNRLWATIDPSGTWMIPEHLRNSSGERKLRTIKRSVRPGNTYAEVSEFLHGRGPYVDAARLESSDLLATPDNGPSLEIGHQVLDLIELNIERLRACVMVALDEAGHEQLKRHIWAGSQANFPAGDEPYPRWSLWPLVPIPGLIPPVVDEFRLARKHLDMMHEGIRPAGRLYDDGEISELFFLSRRARSADFALHNLEEEAKLLGEPLDFGMLDGRQHEVVFAAEVLGLVARWKTGTSISTAAAIAASGLRSAFWLWLEDDDRAMGVLRIVIEAAARLETWNRKPAKAAKLESRGDLTAPRDWLEAAGWKRLYALNVALGELTHTRANSRWEGARELLVEILPPETDPKTAVHRARGHAFDSVLRLCSRIALSSVERLSPVLKAGLDRMTAQTGIFSEEGDAVLERWFDRTWGKRSFDFGGSIFTDPPAEEEI